MSTDTRINSTLPLPVYTAGARGFNCPGLKLYGYGNFAQLERDGKRLLALSREKLAAKGIFPPANGWPSTAELNAEAQRLEAAR